MTPREFVESLREPVSQRLNPGISLMDARLGEIDGWLECEARFPEWGAGGVKFVQRARASVEAGTFLFWLGNLPPVKR